MEWSFALTDLQNRTAVWSIPNETPPADVTQEPRSFVVVSLTARQIEILRWVREGKSGTDIGGILGISRRTVEHHIEKICERLGVKTRHQAVLHAHDMGLLGR